MFKMGAMDFRSKDIYIFDVDGTLTNVGDRVKVIQNKPLQECHWNEFFRRCIEDTPNKKIIKLMCDLMQVGAEIYVFTGREEAQKDVTIDQINSFCVANYNRSFYPTKMRMRKDGDRSEDTEIKSQWYEELTDDEKSRIVCVFEDGDSVTDMWRKLGLTCCQVRPGNY